MELLQKSEELNKMSEKILLLTPPFSLKGGVVEFNRNLIKYSSNKFILFEFRSSLKDKVINKVLYLLLDYLRFIKVLSTNKNSIVHINPSLGEFSIVRDSFYIIISRLFKKKIYIHWHGWNESNEFLFSKYSSLIKNSFFKVDHIKVLSRKFKKVIQKYDFNGKITIGSTFVDDDLIGSHTLQKDGKIRILFLSTISKNKGIYESITLFKKLEKTNKNIEFIIAGDGPEYSNILNKFSNEPNIKIIGHVSGEEKRKIFQSSDIYLFPSYYEGMPTSVLEAFCFGLPVVASNVGAIKEILKDGMGFIINEHNLIDYEDKLIKLIHNTKLRQTISNNNKKIGNSLYLSSIVIKNIDNDYKQLLTS
ncbi:glycosyltransferase [Flammeovirga pectinis]|uniref:Glycosyltransferase n=1 Tax=Flammeovirga pectinis TaxID=2494373 RepID=A0A3S9P032_9BACT|nr:glycosyltransferase family 4 protein [Flammeovirga pectinis]AZQ61543.1 glycosyltransferase [Flammeovirga pectinis]